MRTAGGRQYYTETEAVTLSGLDADAISLCAREGVVKPLKGQNATEYADNDVLLLKAINSLIKARRAFLTTQELRRRFDLPEWSSKPRPQKNAATKAMHRVVEKLLLAEG